LHKLVNTHLLKAVLPYLVTKPNEIAYSMQEDVDTPSLYHVEREHAKHAIYLLPWDFDQQGVLSR
jgi:hypothetical protein